MGNATCRAATVAAMREPARAHTSTKHAVGAGVPGALEVFVQTLGRWIVFVVCVAAVISLIVRIIVIASLDSSVTEDLDLFTAVGRFDGFVWFAATAWWSVLCRDCSSAASLLSSWRVARPAPGDAFGAMRVSGVRRWAPDVVGVNWRGTGLHRVGSDARPQQIDVLYIVVASVAAALMSPALLVCWYGRRLRRP